MTILRGATLAAALAAALLMAAACSKEKTPKVEDPAAERAAALERARHDTFGTQVQALDKAKALEADVNTKATQSVDNIEKDAK